MATYEELVPVADELREFEGACVLEFVYCIDDNDDRVLEDGDLLQVSPDRGICVVDGKVRIYVTLSEE